MTYLVVVLMVISLALFAGVLFFFEKVILYRKETLKRNLEIESLCNLVICLLHKMNPQSLEAFMFSFAEDHVGSSSFPEKSLDLICYFPLHRKIFKGVLLKEISRLTECFENGEVESGGGVFILLLNKIALYKNFLELVKKKYPDPKMIFFDAPECMIPQALRGKN